MTTGRQDDSLDGRGGGQPSPHPGGAQQYQNPQQPSDQQPHNAGMNQMAPGPGHPGALGPRFGARILDGLIVGIPSVIVMVVFNIIGTMTGSIGAWFFGVLSAVVYVVAVMGYFTWMEANRGQTLGKQVLNLRIERSNGGNPTMQQAFKRNAFYLIGFGGYLIGAVLSIGALWILASIVQFIAGVAGLVVIIVIAVSINSSPTKQGKHDEFAGGTRVVTTQ